MKVYVVLGSPVIEQGDGTTIIGRTGEVAGVFSSLDKAREWIDPRWVKRQDYSLADIWEYEVDEPDNDRYIETRCGGESENTQLDEA